MVHSLWLRLVDQELQSHSTIVASIIHHSPSKLSNSKRILVEIGIFSVPLKSSAIG